MILRHYNSLSAGVAVLFSKSFIPHSYNVEEVIKGRVLKVKASFENCSFVFVCVYTPTVALERKIFLNTLDNVLNDSNTDEFFYCWEISIALKMLWIEIMLNHTCNQERG